MGLRSVCFVGNYAHYSGALEVFRNIAVHLRSRGIRTAYVYHKTRVGDVIADLSVFDEVHLVDDCEHITRDALAGAVAAIANRFDLVHTSLIPQEWRFLLKAALTRPHVETYHSPDGWKRTWHQYQIRLAQGVEKPADVTVAVSFGLRDLIAATSGLPAVCIPNGVRIPETMAPGGPYVSYCGRISGDKGLDAWIRVALAVRQRIPEAKFQWIGQPSPGNDGFWYQCVLAACPWLEVTGFTPDPSSYYQRSAVLLMTSPSEGLPMCLLEAHAHGVPAVSLDVGDSRETGAIMVQTPTEAVPHVVSCLRMPSLAYRQMIRADAAARFSLEAMGAAYLEVYRQCI